MSNANKPTIPPIPFLVGISLVQLTILLPFSSYIASLPLIQQQWQMSNVESAIVFSAHLIGFAVASLLVIPLTDRIPSSHIMLAGIVLLVASNLLFPSGATGVWSAT